MPRWPRPRHAIATLMALLTLAPLPLHAQPAEDLQRGARIVDTDYFTTSARCAMCHSSSPDASALRDAQGRSVAPSDLWPATMMANSSVDPFWRAVLATEIAATPLRTKDIEAECLKCHAPLAFHEARLTGTEVSRALFLQGNSMAAELAADGVSCTLCHQIPPDGLGDDATFSGKLAIGTRGTIWGPHPQPFTMPMYRHTGYLPAEGAHVKKSAMCASCHTLFTHAMTADGRLTGHVLLEQGPYVEWQNSQYNDEGPEAGDQAASCQSCHMPSRDADGQRIRTRIARNPHGFDFPPVRVRNTFSRHAFTGANRLMLTVLRDNRETLKAHGTSHAYDASIAETKTMLAQHTARIAILRTDVVDNRLTVDVRLVNLAGHKLPTGYPSRRMWIRLRISDRSGSICFASGEYDDQGKIVDAELRPLDSEQPGGPIARHLDLVTDAAQVQIYESIMEDAAGRPTYLLLRGARYAKDNRILPAGWRSDHPRGPLTAAVSVDDDASFVAGEDAVRYVIDGLREGESYVVEATLLFQTLGARYAAELFSHELPEVARFQSIYEAADPRPEILSRDTKQIESRPRSTPSP